ncbi:universal stress protein [Crocosphaera sp. UHCC 0190]|uniref:universal stress protein n=1 Tax=Crocosphaera sp. UHCC 0190 TaxID=3110246 RepID=UPI002B1F5572|nr:universal stress protein [Crocosphaera sp. UHCC 0190]MEA5510364.1 universal stress protein [Crocosphaera sp. UHCC 0190]
MVKTILVALDCSTTSEPVIQALDALYIPSHSKIILAHVLPSSDNEVESHPEQPHQLQSLRYQQVEQQLQAYQGQVSGSQMEIVNGDPAEEIIRLANIYNADLIVIGTRGLQGVTRVIERSVSDQVVAEATCSVFVVKS